MTAGEFSAEEWIDSLARALPGLAEAQEPYLQEYDRQNPRVHAVYGGPDGDPPAFPLDDLQDLYLMGHHAQRLGRTRILRAPVRSARPSSQHSAVASHAGAGCESNYRTGRILDGDPKLG